MQPEIVKEIMDKLEEFEKNKASADLLLGFRDGRYVARVSFLKVRKPGRPEKPFQGLVGAPAASKQQDRDSLLIAVQHAWPYDHGRPREWASSEQLASKMSMTPHALGKKLRPLGVRPEYIPLKADEGGGRIRGYKLANLRDAIKRFKAAEVF
jgi:hypothetical protein